MDIKRTSNRNSELETFVNIEDLKARDTILKTIKEHSLFSPGDHIVMGLSGGPDSLCLFDVLFEEKDELGIELTAVHINHKFRPGAAEEDQRFVEEFCESRGVTCNSFEVDCEKLAAELDMTSEEAGRKARYDSFNLVARAVEVMGAPHDRIKIVVAHNRNDQAETVLFRIIRGTGTDGLSGMEYSYMGGGGYEIIRPLLDTQRSDILKYCNARKLEPRMDHTNEQAIYGRNKIRLKVIPGIDDIMGSDVTEALMRLRDTAAEDRAYMEKQTRDAYEQALIEDRLNDRIRLDRRSLAELDDAVRHRVIMKALNRIGLSKDIGRVHLLAADGIILSDEASSSLNFPKGYVMHTAYDSVWLQYEGEDSVQNAFDALADKFGISSGRQKEAVDIHDNERDTKVQGKAKPRFRAKLMTIDEYREEDVLSDERVIEQDASLHGDPRELYRKKVALDAEKAFGMPSSEIRYSEDNIHMGDSDEPEDRVDIICIGLTKTLLLRTRREGDFINLNVGRKTIQDLFVDMKVPRHMRDDVRMIACGGEVLWVPDIPGSAYGHRARTAEKYSVSDETKRVLILEMIYEL
jgi:tRNA(Ile)-lysidine synthase